MTRALGTLALTALWCVFVAAGPAPANPGVQSDLDAFMAQVLARRDENWKKLQQYILDEREKIQLIGTGRIPLWGEERTYTWYIRDGFFVRSPLTANGVTISEQDRRKYEADFLQRVKERDRKDKERQQEEDKKKDGEAAAPQAPQETPHDIGGLIAQTRQPQFIDTAYFLKFKFEPGKYALAGRESLNGVDVLRIEYYPARLFSHEQESADKRKAEGSRDRKEDVEETMERMMNKVALVTLWVTPAAHQIVKYTFDNVNLDFLPAASFIRINDLKATMTMGQPFKDVWLPSDVEMNFGAMLAVGSIDVRYHVDYANYREAATSGRLLSTSPR